MDSWFDETSAPGDINYIYGGAAEQRDVPERAGADYPVIEHGPWAGWREVGYVDDTETNLEMWPTGAVRDRQDDKSRVDLIDPEMILRLGHHLAIGAENYGEFNWTQGIPSQRYMASLLRHIFAYYAGDDSEDHLSAALFNVMGLMRNEGTDLDDLFVW